MLMQTGPHVPPSFTTGGKLYRRFLREPSLRVTTKTRMVLHLSIEGEGSDWVTEPEGAINKANLTFTSKFLWLIVRCFLSPTDADNIVTWDHVVTMVAMITGF